MLKEAERTGNEDLKAKAIEAFIRNPLDYGKDQDQKGIFYFLDVDCNDPLQLEWDMKLW